MHDLAESPRDNLRDSAKSFGSAFKVSHRRAMRPVSRASNKTNRAEKSQEPIRCIPSKLRPTATAGQFLRRGDVPLGWPDGDSGIARSILGAFPGALSCSGGDDITILVPRTTLPSAVCSARFDVDRTLSRASFKI